MRVGLALGSNLDDRMDQLQTARAAIFALARARPPFLISPVYATEAISCESGAGEFLNAVIEVGYEGDLRGLLADCRRIEATLGRPSGHARNQSRTIDIDLLYADDIQLREPDLQIPHPRMAGRLFVMQPLAEIRPELILPGQQQPVAEIVAGLEKSDTVRALTNEW
jgi:2-amino-4-hydroxy-6-hydroxymethyldihydropteridine diphosphokinase